MHYIRLLRPPKLAGRRSDLQIQLLFTITTDLGDSFLWPQKYFGLQVVATATNDLGTSSWLLSEPGRLFWEPGMRVLKPTFELPMTFQRAIEEGARIEVCVRAAEAKHSADGASRILAVPLEKPRYRSEAAEHGLVMPAWVSLNLGSKEVDVLTRKIHLGESGDRLGYVEIEEEIGESIARHIWDAGVLALCTLAGLYTLPDHDSSQHACMKAMRNIIAGQPSLNVLELGCGVGILGVGLASMYPKLCASGKCTILMTDLQEAEGRARANIDRMSRELMALADPPVRMLYENLDWEEGRQGKFGPQLVGRPWDLVMLSDCTYNVDMLPALVETLSAIHTANLKHAGSGGPSSTKVFLATKPRHESEQALFDLLDRAGWAIQHRQELPLPVLGAQPQAVEMYLFEKSGPSLVSH